MASRIFSLDLFGSSAKSGNSCTHFQRSVKRRLTTSVVRTRLFQLDRDIVDVGPAQFFRHVVRPAPIASFGRYLSTIMLRVAAGRLTVEPVQLLGHLDLAAEARGVGEAEGEIEHVLLVLGRGLQHVVPFGVDDHVAGRAGERALAGAFQADVVAVRDFQHRKADRRIHFEARPIRIDEGHLRHLLDSARKSAISVGCVRVPGPAAIRGRVSCHTRLDLVKGMAFQRQGDRPVHPALGKGMGCLIQLIHRRIDEIAILAFYGLAKLSDC